MSAEEAMIETDLLHISKHSILDDQYKFKTPISLHEIKWDHTNFRQMKSNTDTLKCPQTTICVVYFADLCTNSISNVLLLNIKVHFILLPVADFQGNNSHRVRKEVGKDKT